MNDGIIIISIFNGILFYENKKIKMKSNFDIVFWLRILLNYKGYFCNLKYIWYNFKFLFIWLNL